MEGSVKPLLGVKAGEKKMVELHVGMLPSGTPISIRAQVIRSTQPGPVVLLLGGLHGDEINGIEIVRKVIVGDIPSALKRGSIIAIPLLNVFGFLNYSRDVPDGKDINRSFPGSATGSLAGRVAFTLSNNVLPLIDFGLDFHTGGRSHYNHPQVRVTPSDNFGLELAKIFSAPITLQSKTIAKSFRKTASTLGKSILVYEGGENLRINKKCVEVALSGVRRVLAAHDMIDTMNDSPSTTTIEFDKHSWLRAKRAGLFVWEVSSGAYVEKGQILGRICDPYGGKEYAIKSPRQAFVIGHDNSPVISQGDALFHLAWSSN